ncbi:MAG: hypothetical protein AAFX10_11185, partial [Pseudomonadota bacterium]
LYAFVYRPATNQTPVELPKGTAVYGLSFAVEPEQQRLDRDTFAWYSGTLEAAETTDERPLWLFPHNDPRMFMPNNPPTSRFVGVDPWRILADDPDLVGFNEDDAELAVRHAQTFVIQFAPDGSVVTSLSGGGTQEADVYIELPDGPIARAIAADEEARPYDDPFTFDPENITGRTVRAEFRPSGPEDIVPNPEVRARSAVQVAVVDIQRMGEDLGVQRPWFARPATSDAPQPEWIDDLGYYENDGTNALHRRISRWIDDNAEIISFSRYTGNAIRRSPS